MKVYDHEVTEKQFAYAVERMQRGHFKAADVEEVLRAAGVPQHTYDKRHDLKFLSNRVADRIIQDYRKRGKIERSNGGWRWKS